MKTPKYSPQTMVGWYDPPQLAKTAVDVLTATIIGEQADNRLVEGFVTTMNLPIVTDYSVEGDGTPRTELWMDCVADIGDGWNPTYAVAKALAEPSLTIHDLVTTPGAPRTITTPRGRVLVIGGDLVYPVATRDQYQARCVGPYACALPHTDEPSPEFFAIPGNHDWYDGLVSFTRTFCNGRWLGGWRSKQERSYFALKLPHGWWLLGTDMQLDSDLDAPQLAFFRDVATKMAPTDRVIVCGHYPTWIFEKWYGDFDPRLTESNLAFLDENVLGGRARIVIAGHLHFYTRHAHPDGRQKIVTGGGGAFLQPTHGLDMRELEGGFSLESCYPSPAVSRRLAWRNLGFLVKNPWFGIVPGVLYALTSCAVNVNLAHRGPNQFLAAVDDVARSILVHNPFSALLLLVLLAGTVFFTDTHSPVFRYVGGIVHAGGQIFAAFLLAWGVCVLLVDVAGFPFATIRFSAAASLLMLAGGWIIGSVLMGIYLLISLNVFGRHYNEAFSSLQIADWKNFLRLHFTANGDLEIYPCGIRRVSRRWPPKTDGSEPAPRVELIEPVIICK